MRRGTGEVQQGTMAKLQRATANSRDLRRPGQRLRRADGRVSGKPSLQERAVRGDLPAVARSLRRPGQRLRWPDGREPDEGLQLGMRRGSGDVQQRTMAKLQRATASGGDLREWCGRGLQRCRS